MSDPSWAPARRLAGNYDDDDGQVLDSFMTTDPTPPDPFPAAATPIPAPSPEPKRPTRFISGTFVLDPANSPAPALIVPQDVDRESLSVRVISDNPTDYILLGEEANRVASENLAHRLQSGQGGAAQGFDSHTGAVWAALPAQNNYAAVLDPTNTGGWSAVNGTLDTVPAPWDPTRTALRLTSTATGSFAIRSAAVPAFMRSGQTVIARAKVQTNLFSAITLAVSAPGTSTNLASANATGIANTQAGWRELILTGTLQRDAGGNVAFYISGTSAAIGDTIVIGDLVMLDRPYQGRTVISWAVVTK